MKYCPICNNESPKLFTKLNVDYYKCNNCQTIYSAPLNNENLVGGAFEVDRNEKQNHLRIERIDKIVNVIPSKDLVNILDFGCGHGMFIDDLKKSGYTNVDGYDAFYEPYSKLPKTNFYHVVSMVECIEHTSPPFVELDVIFRSLVNGGCLMIETSFTDVAFEDNIPLEDFFYISPQAGHSTIFSHHGLDLLMSLKGFIVKPHFDRHVRLYQKFIK